MVHSINHIYRFAMQNLPSHIIHTVSFMFSSWRETHCSGRGASFRHFLSPGACCCSAMLTVGNDNLLHFISQLVYLVLQATHVFFKHACPVCAPLVALSLRTFLGFRRMGMGPNTLLTCGVLLLSTTTRS